MADGPVMIDAREAKVLVGTATKGVKKAALGIGRVHGAGGHVAQKLAEFGRIHDQCVGEGAWLTFPGLDSNITRIVVNDCR